MSPEEWLRERGIEVKRGHVGGHGDIAVQYTSAMPALESDVPPIEAMKTQQIPAIPSAAPLPTPANAEPITPPTVDITTIPTAALREPQVPDELPENIRVIRVGAFEQVDEGIDFWPTVALPVVKAEHEPHDISQMPTRRLHS